MEKTDYQKITVASSEVPANWLYCFLSDCKMRDACVRYQTGLTINHERTWGNAVYPTALMADTGRCIHFKQLRSIRSAWGFAGIFNNVKACDAPILRKLTKTMLGGNGTYYQYHHGTRRLSPEQQSQIRSLFARYGYTDIEFDCYKTEIDFT